MAVDYLRSGQCKKKMKLKLTSVRASYINTVLLHLHREMAVDYLRSRQCKNKVKLKLRRMSSWEDQVNEKMEKPGNTQIISKSDMRDITLLQSKNWSYECYILNSAVVFGCWGCKVTVLISPYCSQMHMVGPHRIYTPFIYDRFYNGVPAKITVYTYVYTVYMYTVLADAQCPDSAKRIRAKILRSSVPTWTVKDPFHYRIHCSLFTTGWITHSEGAISLSRTLQFLYHWLNDAQWRNHSIIAYTATSLPLAERRTALCTHW